MSWMEQLYRTYEANIGSKSEDAITPIAHIYANAQIEVTLNENGEFLSAIKIPKEDAKTLIPVTTASAAGRGSGVAPYALCDTLEYIAGDLGQYCKTDKEIKDTEKKHRCYMEGLEKWCQSEQTNKKIEAIYKYLASNKIAADLIESDILKIDDNGYFVNEKISGLLYEKSLVRFRVIVSDISQSDKVWDDIELINSYIKYYQTMQNGRTDICYFSGESAVICEKHPNRITPVDSTAKLISSNDVQGFTFKGRFQNAEQASALSYEASQKIHSALTWLVKKQGVYIGNKNKRTFVCWSPKGKDIIDILDPLGFIEYDTDDEIIYKKELIRALNGYSEKFDISDEIIVMSLDAATTGRLSITYYNEVMAYDFWNKTRAWGEQCNWYFTEQKKPYYRIQTPSFHQIVECAFGNKKSDSNDKVLKEHAQRLVKCMLEGQKFPKDIMQALVNRVSMPLSYSGGKHDNYEKLLSTACAVVTKYCKDWKGVSYGMRLDVENQDRSYLFGRLLAVLEQVEQQSAYERGETRETNAIRFQSAFVNHPMQTWVLLEDAVKPYYQKLKPGSREYYRRLISEIVSMLPEEKEEVLNQGLKETYLLGYYLQRAEFNKKRENNQEVEDNE